MVVVINAEAPMMSACTSSALRMNASALTLAPRSWTSKPATFSIVMAMSLPISCMSPSTVPITTTPFFSAVAAVLRSSGSSSTMTCCIARAASIISGRKISWRANSVTHFAHGRRQAVHNGLDRDRLGDGLLCKLDSLLLVAVHDGRN